MLLYAMSTNVNYYFFFNMPTCKKATYNFAAETQTIYAGKHPKPKFKWKPWIQKAFSIITVIWFKCLKSQNNLNVYGYLRFVCKYKQSQLKGSLSGEFSMWVEQTSMTHSLSSPTFGCIHPNTLTVFCVKLLHKPLFICVWTWLYEQVSRINPEICGLS